MVVDTTGSTGADPASGLKRNNTDDETAATTTALTTQVVGESGTVMAATGVSGGGYLGVKYKFFQDSASAQRKAGTYVYTVIVTPFTTTGAGTAQTIDVSVVIAAAATASETVDSTKTTAFLGLAASATADATITKEATASATAAGVLSVRTYNAAGAAAAESVTVSISGAGVLKSGTVAGTSLILNSTGSVDIDVLPDGRAGVGTISVKTTTRTFSDKSITFYAKAAKTITPTVATPLLKVGDNAGAVRASAVDANGVNWTGTFYIVASTAADALVAGSSTTPVQCDAYVATDGYAKCPVTSIAVGTAKFKIIDASTVALATATSSEVTVTVTQATLASVKIEFDKATYAPNERAMIYVTPLDSAGKAMQTASYTSLFSSTGISVNGALSYTGSTTTAESLTAAGSITTAAQNSSTSRARAGSMQYTVYMPSSGGAVTLTATGGTALAESLRRTGGITATATVTDSGAAALAAVTALATTVASLKTLITTLTNLVLKIQKKVKA
jgi:hypothetical protein